MAPHSQVERNRCFEVFWFDQRGKRRVEPAFGGPSVAAVLSGRVPNGDDGAQKLEANEFLGAAGVRSNGTPRRPCRRIASASQGDNARLGYRSRSEGNLQPASGAVPDVGGSLRFVGCAGKPSEEISHRPLRKADYPMQAQLCGASVGRGDRYCREKSPRPTPNLANLAVADSIIYGHSMDETAPESPHSPHEGFMRAFDDHAGIRCGDRPLWRPIRKPQDDAVRAVLGDVIIGLGAGAGEAAGGQHAHQRFLAKFDGCAGTMSGQQRQPGRFVDPRHPELRAALSARGAASGAARTTTASSDGAGAGAAPEEASGPATKTPAADCDVQQASAEGPPESPCQVQLPIHPKRYNPFSPTSRSGTSIPSTSSVTSSSRPSGAVARPRWR